MAPDFHAQFREVEARKPEAQIEQERMEKIVKDAGPDWDPHNDGRHFVKARAVVARKLGWCVDSVMPWEVISYLRLDRPPWASRAGIDFSLLSKSKKGFGP